MDLLGVLEGILFVMGDEGCDLKTLTDVMEITDEEAKELLAILKKSYEASDRGLRISFLGNAFKLTTKQEHRAYYEKLVVNPGTNRLSQASLETLAIVAYNQPITATEISELRGVASGHLIRKLVAKGLLKESGKSDLPGRPNLYCTTSDFLDYFGLATLDELPKIDQTIEGEKETDLFTSIYKDEEESEVPLSTSSN